MADWSFPSQELDHEQRFSPIHKIGDKRMVAGRLTAGNPSIMRMGVPSPV